MSDDPLISNVAAEQEVLGTVLANPSSEAFAAFVRLQGSDFAVPKHEMIAAVLWDMITNGKPITVISVANELEARAELSRAGGILYLHELLSASAPSGMNLGYYAAILREKARQRRSEVLGMRLSAAARGYNETGDGIGEWLEGHRRALDEMPPPFEEASEDVLNHTLGVLLEEPEREEEPLIPGYLYRQERHVLVAPEGVVKSTLFRQHAVCLAGGLHPWTGQRVSDGLRVLFIDAENSRDQSRRAYRWVAGRCYKPTMAPGWKDRVFHLTRNAGLDLPGRDAQWFRDVAAKVSPDVILLGPVYKLARPNSKMDAESAAAALHEIVDEVRVRQDAAVMLEAHAPHGHMGSRDMRPFGASSWLRWPEIGAGYRRDTDVPDEHQARRPEYLEFEDWRGSRETRDWPLRIRYGDDRREMPWVPNDPNYSPSVEFDYVIPDGERRG